MIVKPIKTGIFKEGENLLSFIVHYLKKIPERSIIVVTSKIVALSERRVALFKNAQTKDLLIRKESNWALPTKLVWLTMKDGMFMANAGIDESNAKGKLILLPKNSYKTADLIRKSLRKKFKIKNLGILITDSRTMPLRSGVTGVALGYSGFKGLRDYRGTKDIFGRKFQYSRANVPDSLAASAVLVMGEGNERFPLVIIKDAPVEFCDKVSQKDLKINFKDDMYKPLFSRKIK